MVRFQAAVAHQGRELTRAEHQGIPQLVERRTVRKVYQVKADRVLRHGQSRDLPKAASVIQEKLALRRSRRGRVGVKWVRDTAGHTLELGAANRNARSMCIA